MADYDHWDQPCCGGFPGHKEHCHNHPHYSAYKNRADKRAQGYVWSLEQQAYRCRRGCGTLVWDTDAHSKNVCTEFKPIVG